MGVCSKVLVLADVDLHHRINMSEAIPKELRQLRACLSCSMIKTLEQWEADGCQNREAFLNLRHNRDNVYDCTSSNFEGMVGACKPDDSWVCKWQRISRFKQGVYAISVSGSLPQSIIRDMRSSSIPYKSRDTSKRRTPFRLSNHERIDNLYE